MIGQPVQRRAGSLLLYPAYVQDYLDRVTAADVAAGNSLGLERAVTDAISTCLQVMVSDGSLGISAGVLSQAASLIKVGCSMMGARTLPGALVPLAATMPAPTNVNFVGGDYNRRTGLGDPANAAKYLDCNFLQNAAPQDSFHMALYLTSKAAGIMMGSTPTGSTTPTDNLAVGAATDTYRFRSRFTSGSFTDFGNTNTFGFIGHTRSAAASFTARSNGANTTVSETSSAPGANAIHVFRRPFTSSPGYSSSRASFYSVGVNLDLASLDARITALALAIQAAIP